MVLVVNVVLALLVMVLEVDLCEVVVLVVVVVEVDLGEVVVLVVAVVVLLLLVVAPVVVVGVALIISCLFVVFVILLEVEMVVILELLTVVACVAVVLDPVVVFRLADDVVVTAHFAMQSSRVRIFPLIHCSKHDIVDVAVAVVVIVVVEVEPLVDVVVVVVSTCVVITPAVDAVAKRRSLILFHDSSKLDKGRVGAMYFLEKYVNCLMIEIESIILYQQSN